MRTSEEKNHNSARKLQGRLGRATTGVTLSLIRDDAGSPERLLYVADVRLLLRGAKSVWWILNHFAPELRLKIGRTVAWHERDALRWIEDQRAPR